MEPLPACLKIRASPTESDLDERFASPPGSDFSDFSDDDSYDDSYEVDILFTTWAGVGLRAEWPLAMAVALASSGEGRSVG